MNKNNRTWKRALALAGAVILGSMYVLTLVFSLMKNDLAQALFRGALALTFIVPVLLYMILMMAKVLKPKKSEVIDAVIFDIGKVLTDFPWDTYTGGQKLSPEAEKVIREKVVPSELWRDFDLNDRPYEDIVKSFVALDPRFEKEIRQVVETEDQIVKPFWYTEDLIHELKRKGYRVYYLSNWAKEWYENLKDSSLAFTKKMDGGLFSFEVHAAKPDPKIYRMLTDRYGLDPGRCLFIDDAPENVEAAKACGMAAIHFTSYSDMLEKLRSVGVEL